MEGGVPFEREYGMNAFEYPATDQRFNKVFNRAMSNHTTLAMRKMLDIYTGFDDLKVLVDVGGGIGVALGVITAARPHIKGINYDLPHVLANAPPYPGLLFIDKVLFSNAWFINFTRKRQVLSMLGVICLKVFRKEMLFS